MTGRGNIMTFDLNEIRRSMEELVARYELEPELRDIYVEGRADSMFFQWFLERSGKPNAAVYEIGTVNVPYDVLHKHGLDDGERGRVIGLALELDRKLLHPHQVTCIADKDFDTILGKEYSCSSLLLTDYSSLEMYAFNERNMGKFISLVVRTDAVTPTNLINKLHPVLQSVFLIRAAAISLDLGLSLIPFTKCCECRKGNLNFDVEEFLKRSLTSSGKWGQRDDLVARIASMRTSLGKEIRLYIRGHDLSHLLLQYLSSLQSERLFNAELIERSLLGCLEYHDLVKEKLFADLLERV